MKIRMGFVTNSSSYSSTSLFIRSKKLVDWLRENIVELEDLTGDVIEMETYPDEYSVFASSKNDAIYSLLEYYDWEYDYAVPDKVPQDIIDSIEEVKSGEYTSGRGEFFGSVNDEELLEGLQKEYSGLEYIGNIDDLSSVIEEFARSEEYSYSIVDGKEKSIYTEKLTDFTFSDGVDHLFKNTNVLEISKGVYKTSRYVKEINKKTFAFLKNIEKLIISKNVEDIKKHAFSDLNVKTIVFEENSKVRSISNGAFAYTRNLTLINIPNSINNIGDYAFYDARSLVSIEISKNIKSIGLGVFDYSNNLTNIIVNEENEYYSSLDGVLYNKDQTILIKYPEGKKELEFEIPKNVVEIKSHAFINIPFLKSVIIPSSVKKINKEAFDDCKNLTIYAKADKKLDYWDKNFKDSKIPITWSYSDSIKSEILSYNVDSNKNAFVSGISKAIKDTNITIPNKVNNYPITKILTNAFKNSNITTITISNTITIIEEQTFNNLKNLTSIDVDSENENYSSINGVLYNKDQTILIKYPEGKLDKKLTIPKSVLTILKDAFKNSKVEEIVFEENSKLTLIDKYLFGDGSKIKSIIIPKTVKKIGKGAFSHSKLEQIVFEKDSKLTTIEEYAFSQTENLKRIIIPRNVEIIGTEAFRNSQIEEIIFEKDSKLTTIEEYAFSQTKNLKRIIIPRNVITIGESAFRNSNVETFLFEDNSKLTYLPECIFSHAEMISSIVIPKSIIIIKKGAFQFSTIKDITFEENSKLTTIEEEAFRGLKNLKTITIPENVINIGKDAFEFTSTIIYVSKDENLANFGKDWFSSSNIIIYNKEKEITQDGIIFSISKDKKATVIGFTNELPIDVVIPSSIEGYEVVEISKNAFYSNKKIKTIFIPKSIKKIENSAFSCSTLEKVVFEENSNLTSIDEDVFAGTQFEEMTIPKSVTTIEYHAFNYSKIKKITFEENSKITNMHPEAFEGTKLETVIFKGDSSLKVYKSHFFKSNRWSGNENLKNIQLPTNLKSIGEKAFYETKKLKQIIIPKSVGRIGENAFAGSSIESIIFEEGSNLKKIGAEAFSGNYRKKLQIKSLIIPKSVEIIENGVFCNSNIESITFEKESKLKIINNKLFYETSKLKSIEIPKSVEFIGENPFGYSGIETITFEKGSKLKTIGKYAFYRMKVPNINFKDILNLVKIDDYAFSYATLKEMEIPKGIKTIGERAFQFMDIEKIIFADVSNLISVGKFAFLGCSTIIFINQEKLPDSFDLKWICSSNTVIVGNNETIVENGIIYELTKDKKAYVVGYDDDLCNDVIIPKQVKNHHVIEIASKAFLNNKKIKSIMIPNTIKAIRGKAFKNSTLQKITFEENSKVLVIGRAAFKGTKKLKDITIPSSVESISGEAFSGSSINKLTFEENSQLKEIGWRAFAWAKVKQILIPNSVTHISEEAFLLINIILSKLNKRPKDWVFDSFENVIFNFEKTIIEKGIIYALTNDKKAIVIGNNNKLDVDVNIPKEVEGYEVIEISKSAFENKKKMKNIFIANSVTKIGEDAFSNSRIKEITFEENSKLKIIDWSAFKNTKDLLSIKIPKSVTKIGYSAFEYSELKVITFEENSKLKIIDWSAFENTKGLLSIKIPKNVTAIGDSAFSNSGLEKIIFEKNSKLKKIGSFAFKDAKNLKSIIISKEVSKIGVIFLKIVKI